MTLKNIKKPIKPIDERKTLTLKDWKTEAETLFGPEVLDWRFKCPQCGESQSLREFSNAKISDAEDKFYFSCIGRWIKDRGCDWTLGGLFLIHKTEVIAENGKAIPVFEFADPEEVVDGN